MIRQDIDDIRTFLQDTDLTFKQIQRRTGYGMRAIMKVNKMFKIRQYAPNKRSFKRGKEE